MPECPQCHSQYREGFTRCADCDVDLLPSRPPPPPDAVAEVFRGEAAQADVVRAALEAAGIGTLAPDEYVSALGWYATRQFHEVRILVRGSDLARARDALETLRRVEPESEDPRIAGQDREVVDEMALAVASLRRGELDRAALAARLAILADSTASLLPEWQEAFESARAEFESAPAAADEAMLARIESLLADALRFLAPPRKG